MTKALMIFLLAFASAVSAQEVPKHLELARRLVDTVKPENNHYVYRGTQGVRLAGDLFTSEDTINTMCSAFVTAMFERTKHPAIDKIKWGGEWVNGYLRVSSFATAIEQGRGLDKLSNLKDVVPGDLFVFSCIDACATKEGASLGHVGFFDAIPEKLDEPQEPLVPGTIQWKVAIVDVVDIPWTRMDTRYMQAGPKGQGVGRGVFRIYTDEHGSPVGYKAGGPYWPNSKRSILLGHPQN